MILENANRFFKNSTISPISDIGIKVILLIGDRWDKKLSLILRRRGLAVVPVVS